MGYERNLVKGADDTYSRSIVKSRDRIVRMELERLTYRVEEVAKLLGIGRNQAYEAIKRGDIPTIKLGNRLLIPKRGLDRMLDGEPA